MWGEKLNRQWSKLNVNLRRIKRRVAELHLMQTDSCVKDQGRFVSSVPWNKNWRQKKINGVAVSQPTWTSLFNTRFDSGSSIQECVCAAWPTLFLIYSCHKISGGTYPRRVDTVKMRKLEEMKHLRVTKRQSRTLLKRGEQEENCLISTGSSSLVSSSSYVLMWW